MDESKRNLQTEKDLYKDVCSIIDNARLRVATYVNSEVCLLNWYVGKRIKEDILGDLRAEYGKQVLRNLAKKLTERYGTGWGYEKLKHSVRAAYTFTEEDYPRNSKEQSGLQRSIQNQIAQNKPKSYLYLLPHSHEINIPIYTRSVISVASGCKSRRMQRGEKLPHNAGWSLEHHI